MSPGVLHTGILLILAVLPLSSEKVYVRTGSDITDCGMKCPHADGNIRLYKDCEGKNMILITLWCHRLRTQNENEPRLHLDTRSGCWTLRDAWKNDSCVYNVTLYRSQETFLLSTQITVLDPVLISNITSNSSRLGEDIAVSVQFSGEEATLTWEVDGGPLPDRYRLIDDNRTVIIPRAQRDDAERRLRVRITNPVSEETREHQLEITVSGSSQQMFRITMASVFTVKLLFLLSMGLLSGCSSLEMFCFQKNL
ncbi:uncharacterized protein LOC143814944 [Ranitomeya variabilis]|uniref:uncharacterized protein LOC143814944 n=1 Tax=Ranitomeya variabilis TaxID=490064 RepID=UPI0040572A48